MTVRLELLAEKAGQWSAEGTESQGGVWLPVRRLKEVMGTRLLSLLVTGQLPGEEVRQLQVRWTGQRAVLLVQQRQVDRAEQRAVLETEWLQAGWAELLLVGAAGQLQVS